ncbi:uncharacterized protein [Dermacentor albipictus]|uniref:uncharacterized protein isoform X3 n=1 Tax=Dermacentor albipictus TaxID=60249 RepID=UPI0038FC55EC
MKKKMKCMLRASSLLLLLVLCTFRCCRSIKLVAKKLQVHRVRLHDSLVMPCAAKEGVMVRRARWSDQAGGTAWLNQALLSESTGRLRFPKVTAVLSGHYECSGYVRLPRREVFIIVHHEIQVFESDKNGTGCRVGYVVNDRRCYVCRPGSFSPGGEFRNCIPCDFGSYTEQHGSPFCLWCPPGKSTYTQGSTSPNDCEVSWVIYTFLFGITTLTSVVLFVCRVSQAWSSERRVRTIIMEDKLSRCFQPKVLPPSRSRASGRPVMTHGSRKSASLQEEQQPLLAATTSASRQAVGTQTDDHFHVDSAHRGVQTESCEPKPPASSAFLEERVVAPSKAKDAAPCDQETMFKELLARTARNSRRLDRRKNTPQPRHFGLMKPNAVGGSHGPMQKPPLAARRPSEEFSPWCSQNRSAQRKARKIGAPAPVTSPPAKTPANLCGRPNRRSAECEFENNARYEVPAWNSSPEDYRRTSHSARILDDVPSDVRRIYEAADSGASDGSVPLYGRFAPASPQRSAWPSPLGREDRHDQLSSAVPPPPRRYQAARGCRHSEGQFVNQASHGEEYFIPPRGAYSSPGTRNRPGATNMFRRFDSTMAWVTDEYSKHKQQGPGYYGSPNA